MIGIFRNNFGWIKDIAMVIGMVGVLYLNSHFITIDKFDDSQTKNEMAHQGILTTLVSVDKTLALMANNQVEILEIKADMKIRTEQINELISQNRIDAAFNELFKDTSVKVATLETKLNGVDMNELNRFMKESAIQRAQLEVRLKAVEVAAKLSKE